MINFTDIIKGKFLEEFSAIAPGDMLIAIGLSFLLSLYVVFIYRVTYEGVDYSHSFAGCLVMISMVTTVVILVIASNIVLSLGMVGALSIVRFRTAVKDATDTAFLFWAIATGILCGTGYVTVSILATLLLGLLFVALQAVRKSVRKRGGYLLVARFDAESPAEEQIAKLPGYRMRNKTMTAEATELVAQVRLDGRGMEMVDALRKLPGVREVSLMQSVGGSTL